MTRAAGRFPLVLAAFVLVLVGHTPQAVAGAPAPTTARHAGAPATAGSYIVSFAPGASGPARVGALTTAGAREPGTALVTFASGAGFAAVLDAGEADALRRLPGVAAVTPNRVLEPATAAQLDRVGAPAAWAAGWRGDGQRIVVVDTGVDVANPNLAGVVQTEACFTPARGDGGGDCPDGRVAQTGPGTAVPCTGAPECAHGTAVASIAAGAGPAVTGVAPGARVIAVRIFSSVRGPDDRVLTDEASLVRALEWIETTTAAAPPAAINLSLGGPPLPTPCGASPALTAVLARLTSAGVAVVASAGNDTSASMLSFPACVPGVVAVAAEGAPGAPASFTNTAPAALLYAPGEGVEGAWNAPCCTRVLSGTSFAAPQVAAAFALLRQQSSAGDVASLAELLRRTGDPVHDAGAGSYAGASAVRLARALDPQYRTVTPAALARPGSPFGAVDLAGTEPGTLRVAGWVLDPDNVAPVGVHVYVDDALVAARVASLVRPDVAAAYPGAGAARGYDVRIPAAPGPHVVCVYGLDLGPGAGNALVGCRTVVLGAPVGALDAVAVTGRTVRVSGWAIDSSRATPTDVVLVVDGVVVARATAVAVRPDVGDAYPAYGGAHGYELTATIGPGAREVCVAALAAAVAVPGTVGCRETSGVSPG